MAKYSFIGRNGNDKQLLARAATADTLEKASKNVQAEFPDLKITEIRDGFDKPKNAKWLVK